MDPFKVVILDNEPDAITAIELIINEFCPQLTIAGTANMIDTGWDIIRSTEPDLVLLDIDMPRGGGFDLLERFPIRKFEVVFITAHSQYLPIANRFEMFDYLLKPIDLDMFTAMVERFVRFKLTNPHYIHKLQL